MGEKKDESNAKIKARASMPNTVSYIRNRARVGLDCGPGTCGIYEGLIQVAGVTRAFRPIVSVGTTNTSENAEILHPQETGEWHTISRPVVFPSSSLFVSCG